MSRWPDGGLPTQGPSDPEPREEGAEIVFFSPSPRREPPVALSAEAAREVAHHARTADANIQYLLRCLSEVLAPLRTLESPSGVLTVDDLRPIRDQIAALSLGYLEDELSVILMESQEGMGRVQGIVDAACTEALNAH